MSVLQKLGAVVKSLFGQSTPPTLDKTEILSTIENLLQLGQCLETSLDKLVTTDSFNVLQKLGVRDLTPEDKQLQKLYTSYFQSLSAHWQQVERTQTFGSVRTAVGNIVSNLETIQSQFSTLFHGVETADIALSETTVSIAALLGWLENANLYFNWILYFIGQLGCGAGDRVPPYQLVWLNDYLDQFINTSRMVLNRPAGESIVTVLNELRRKGGDLALSVSGQTIDTYASDQQYPLLVLSSLNGFSANPRRVMRAVSNQINQIRQWNYERLKTQREWLSSKVGYLVLKSQGLDPDSAEAKRLRSITERYTEMLARLDKKLGSIYDE